MNLKYIIKPWKWNNVFISFGENCVADDILRRYRLKSFTTPYSHGRTNIEYILQGEKDRFASFLDTSKMDYAICDNKQVVRLNVYTDYSNKYESTCINGVEFTHHDVKGNEEIRNTFKRRVERLLKSYSRNLFLFYYHRYCPDTNEELLLEHLRELKEIYQSRNKGNVNVIMFTQEIVGKKEERHLEYRTVEVMGTEIHVFKFHTLNIWQGSNDEIFWGRCDDDLIHEMIKIISYEFKLPGGFLL